MHKDRIVVVTRPRAQAENLAVRLAASGREAAAFPLLDILPLDDSSQLQAAVSELHSYAMAAFVSPNAIDAVFQFISSWPSEVAIAVMGEGSRHALAEHGVTDSNARIFSPLDKERTDSETLLRVLDFSMLKERRVLILRGEDGREFLADALRAQGIDVHQVAAYRRCKPQLDSARIKQLLDLLACDALWLITSSEALRNLREMAFEHAGADGV
ncbi:MAG: uroporphyrinogen synthase, partial [Paucimonas sp.]|nr:uroporphyrinogen synthase [Paucimonas sp.]